MDKDKLCEFLKRKLPQGAQGDLTVIVQALESAGRQYERYANAPQEWRNYGKRRKNLNNIQERATRLRDLLVRLDPISRDDIEVHLGNEKVQTLQGYLSDLGYRSQQMFEEIQTKKGRSRNVPRDRWVQEVADIYECNFRRPATVSGSGNALKEKRGNFYTLLWLSLPEGIRQHWTLHPKTLTRILKSRPKKPKKKQHPLARNGCLVVRRTPEGG